MKEKDKEIENLIKGNALMKMVVIMTSFSTREVAEVRRVNCRGSMEMKHWKAREGHKSVLECDLRLGFDNYVNN